MIQETMDFVKYVVPSLSLPLSSGNAADALKKLCKYGKEFLHPHTGDIIQNVLPEHITNWTSCESNLNIIAALAMLICEVGALKKE